MTRYSIARTVFSAATVLLTVVIGGGQAEARARNSQTIITCDRFGCSDRLTSVTVKVKKQRHTAHRRATYRRAKVDANGNRAISIVKSRSGVAVRVAPSARVSLQCVVDYVEAAGVRIRAMRGYGEGTVRGSLHPSGRAIDINQTDRDVTSPVVPRAVANAAADHCKVISGTRWGYADNGHWNLAKRGRVSQEPWPRVVQHGRISTP